MDISIIYKKPSELKPYENNPRINNASVPEVAASIAEFGFKIPIVIDKNGVIIAGHTRLKAAKRLKLNKVPCIVADDLSDEQIKAFRLADNKVGEKSEWDFDLLADELDDLEIDMEQFGFTFDEDEEEDYAENTQNRVENIVNLGKASYEGDGYYDIPVIEPVYELPEIKEWIGFNYVLSDDEPEGKAVHFFIDDYQFERIWNNPDRYLERLRRYVCVASPDFSPYGDMPHALQIYNHYRKHWIGAYLQQHGVTVIPTIRASSDPRSMDWFLDGEPHGGIIICSNMWSSDDNDTTIDDIIMDNLKPKKMFVYGHKHDNDGDIDCEVEYIPLFTDRHRE